MKFGSDMIGIQLLLPEELAFSASHWFLNYESTNCEIYDVDCLFCTKANGIGQVV